MRNTSSLKLSIIAFTVTFAGYCIADDSESNLGGSKPIFSGFGSGGQSVSSWASGTEVFYAGESKTKTKKKGCTMSSKIVMENVSGRYRSNSRYKFKYSWSHSGTCTDEMAHTRISIREQLLSEPDPRFDLEVAYVEPAHRARVFAKKVAESPECFKPANKKLDAHLGVKYYAVLEATNSDGRTFDVSPTIVAICLFPGTHYYNHITDKDLVVTSGPKKPPANPAPNRGGTTGQERNDWGHRDLNKKKPTEEEQAAINYYNGKLNIYYSKDDGS